MYNMFRKFLEENFGSGYNYEIEVTRLLQKFGFHAHRTAEEEHKDEGVDIVAQAQIEGKPKFYIQCKYHNKTQGLEPIQQVHTGAALRGNDGFPVVITCADITFNARKAAAKLGVEIISLNEWKDLILGYDFHRISRPQNFGLMGILSALSLKDFDHLSKCAKYLAANKPLLVPKEEKAAAKEEVIDPGKEERKRRINDIFEELRKHREEMEDLEKKKAQHAKYIDNLNREAALYTLDYG